MKTQQDKILNLTRGWFSLLLVIALQIVTNPVMASGGSGSGSGGGGGSTSSVETIKVTKCYYFDTGTYVELLISASTSNSSAQLYAYLPDGTYLGLVQNGGRYGGSVFLSRYIPPSILIVSTAGATINCPTSPFQF